MHPQSDLTSVYDADPVKVLLPSSTSDNTYAFIEHRPKPLQLWLL